MFLFLWSWCNVCSFGVFFFFTQKTAYELRIIDCSSDVCSSDLPDSIGHRVERRELGLHVGRKRGIRCGGETHRARPVAAHVDLDAVGAGVYMATGLLQLGQHRIQGVAAGAARTHLAAARSEEHTSELQSLMRISYAVFCLKKKKKNKRTIQINIKKQHYQK